MTFQVIGNLRTLFVNEGWAADDSSIFPISLENLSKYIQFQFKRIEAGEILFSDLLDYLTLIKTRHDNDESLKSVWELQNHPAIVRKLNSFKKELSSRKVIKRSFATRTISLNDSKRRRLSSDSLDSVQDSNLEPDVESIDLQQLDAVVDPIEDEIEQVKNTLKGREVELANVKVKMDILLGLVDQGATKEEILFHQEFL